MTRILYTSTQPLTAALGTLGDEGLFACARLFEASSASGNSRAARE